MKYATVFLILFNGLFVQGQTEQHLLQKLRTENDSLHLELLRCHSTVTVYQLLSERTLYSRAELQQHLLPQIREKSEANYATAMEMIAQTDQFLQYCEQVKDELMRRTHAKDQYSLMRNKEVGTQYFLEEKQGALFKSSIEALRSTFIQAIRYDPFINHLIILRAEYLLSSSRSWEDYTFRNMPLSAIFPLIGKYQSDAEHSEAVVLQYLNQ